MLLLKAKQGEKVPFRSAASRDPNGLRTLRAPGME